MTPDILVVPASNAVGDMTDGVILTDVSDPASALEAAALGLPVDTSLRFRVLGTSFTSMVTDGIAPVVVEAYTNAAGNRVFIPVTAPVFGTEAPGDWAVNDVTGGSATVDSVTIAGNMITLDLSGNLVMPGDAPTLDCTAGDIADGGGDVLASFTDREIINLIPPGFTVVQDGLELMIVNNDGSSFDIDDNHDHCYGTYSIAEGSLDTGPVALVDTVLVDDGAPAVGKTLVVRQPPFAYDPALGDITISYTTSATNAVDTTLPIRVTNAASAACHVLAVKTAVNASNGRMFFTSDPANAPYTGALHVQDDATMFCMMLGSDEALDPSPTLTGGSGIVEGANVAFAGHERWAVAGNIDLDAVDSPHSIGFVQNADGDTGNAGGVFVAVRNVPVSRTSNTSSSGAC